MARRIQRARIRYVSKESNPPFKTETKHLLLYGWQKRTTACNNHADFAQPRISEGLEEETESPDLLGPLKLRYDANSPGPPGFD